MIKKCLHCEKDFKAKKDTAKYCSTSCRVMWNRKHPKVKKDVIEPYQMKNMYNAIMELVGNVNFGANPILEQMPVSASKTVQLPSDYQSISNVAILGSNGDIIPLRKPKSVIRYIEERLECENADDYDKWLANLESDPYLSQRDKQNAKTNII